MGENSMSSLLMLKTKAPEISNSSKANTKSSIELKDSFSGILQEKMSDYSKPSQRKISQSQERPQKEVSKRAEPVEKETTSHSKPVQTTAIKSSDQEEKVAATEVESEDPVQSLEVENEKKPQETQAPAEVLSMMASLLESLIGKLETLVTDQGETTPAQVGEAKQEQAIDPLVVLKTLLDGKMNNLKELIDKLQPQSGDSEATIPALLTELQTLLAKVTQMKGDLNATSKTFVAVELASKEDKNPEALLAQLKAQGHDILNKLYAKVADITKNAQTETVSLGEDSIKAIVPTATAPGENAEAVPESKEEKTAVKVELKLAQATVTTEGNVEANPIVNQEAAVEATPAKLVDNNSAKAEKTEFHLSEKPLSQTVANQVMLKVKLMAGENKQEMELQLKPESLGKLSLKIIHERGEVLAKITAENEQVKLILESNMQLLKDSLEKSGFSVQGLSVSVGNGEGGKNQENQGSQNRAGSSDKVGALTGDRMKEAIKRAFYGQDMDDSQINLTA